MLVMGVAFASNCGGMLSPISSPQNVFGIEHMSVGGKPPGWGLWLAIAVPIALLCVVGIWLYLVFMLRLKTMEPEVALTRIRPVERVHETLSWRHYYTLLVSAATVGLWLANRNLLPLFGGMGLTAIFPMVLLFGGGVLYKDDLKQYPWDVVLLAMGGTVLGQAVRSTGLLDFAVLQLDPILRGLPLMGVFVLLTIFVAIAATFISHTVAAMVFIPVA